MKIRWFVFVLLFAFDAGAARAPAIMVVGDSLSAGYGIELRDGWVTLLQQRLTRQGYPHTVVNASISGDTTAGGRARLPAALKRHRPQIVILELGGNDGLRGLSLRETRATSSWVRRMAALLLRRFRSARVPCFKPSSSANRRERCVARARLTPISLASMGLVT